MLEVMSHIDVAREHFSSAWMDGFLRRNALLSHVIGHQHRCIYRGRAFRDTAYLYPHLHFCFSQNAVPGKYAILQCFDITLRHQTVYIHLAWILGIETHHQGVIYCLIRILRVVGEMDGLHLHVSCSHADRHSFTWKETEIEAET